MAKKIKRRSCYSWKWRIWGGRCYWRRDQV